MSGDILRFKEEFFAQQADAFGEVSCPIAGESMGWGEVHVDHAAPWPFHRIVTEFIRERGIDLLTVQVVGQGDDEVQRRFADDSLAEDFRRFHERIARLRVISMRENLRRSRPGVGKTE